MIHEFLITEKYAIVPDLPMEFDPKGAVKEKRFIFHYNEKAPARYGIWPRNSKSGTDIKWFEVEPHHAFHFGGCWDELNEKGDSVVTLYAVVHEGIQIGLQAEHPLDKNHQQKLEKYVFNMTDLSVKKTTLLEGMYMEFPILNQHYYGHKSRYLYLACRLQANDYVPEIEAEQENEFLSGFIKFD
jgi:carotenoid cleavage dioxygenase